MMRSVLKGAGLPKNLWAEAVIAACYIKNRLTSSSKPTPHEFWFGTKPDVSGLRIYGCTAFVHVPEKREKLWTLDLKNASSLDMHLEIFIGS